MSNYLLACHCSHIPHAFYPTPTSKTPTIMNHSQHPNSMGMQRVDYIDLGCDDHGHFSSPFVTQFYDWKQVPSSTYDQIYCVHCPIYGLWHCCPKEHMVLQVWDDLLREGMRALRRGGQIITPHYANSTSHMIKKLRQLQRKYRFTFELVPFSKITSFPLMTEVEGIKFVPPTNKSEPLYLVLRPKLSTTRSKTKKHTVTRSMKHQKSSRKKDPSFLSWLTHQFVN